MKIEINDIEFKNNQYEIAVLLTHPKKETILILSKNLLSSETYLEYNDQSNAVNDGITEVLIDGNILVINLNEEGIQKIGHKTIQVKLSLTKEDYTDFLENMNFIFDKCLRLTDKPFVPSKSKSIDFSKIKYLNLDGKNLALPPENLKHYVALEKLFIRDNPTLDVNTTITVLAKLPHLKQLQLTITGNIPLDLSKLTALESLHIEGDADFETLPTDIGSLKKLNYIYLQSKKPIVLPPQFSDLTALEFLHVRSKTWKLPDNFYKLSHLKHLDLYNCNITVFPSEMSQMTHLETIILGTNLDRDDSKLFAFLGQLPALRTIEIDISSLPESISDCTQIENLEIYGNDSQGQKFYIPKSFGRLTQLKSLALENCIFNQLPECLFDVVSLRQLQLTNCTFKEIPEQISKLEHLEEISIIDCTAFSDIHTAFSKLKSLRKIYFENVPALQSLPTELHNLTDIDELYLSEYEKIDNVPDHWIKIMNENGG
jgi:Leucine-rich repeat (LRR) protein